MSTPTDADLTLARQWLTDQISQSLRSPAADPIVASLAALIDQVRQERDAHHEKQAARFAMAAERSGHVRGLREGMERAARMCDMLVGELRKRVADGAASEAAGPFVMSASEPWRASEAIDNLILIIQSHGGHAETKGMIDWVNVADGVREFADTARAQLAEAREAMREEVIYCGAIRERAEAAEDALATLRAQVGRWAAYFEPWIDALASRKLGEAVAEMRAASTSTGGSAT